MRNKKQIELYYTRLSVSHTHTPKRIVILWYVMKRVSSRVLFAFVSEKLSSRKKLAQVLSNIYVYEECVCLRFKLLYKSTCKLQSHNISNKHVNWSVFPSFFRKPKFYSPRLSLTHMFEILEHCQRYFDHFYLHTFFFSCNLSHEFDYRLENKCKKYIWNCIFSFALFHITSHCEQSDEFNNIYASTVHNQKNDTQSSKSAYIHITYTIISKIQRSWKIYKRNAELIH